MSISAFQIQLGLVREACVVGSDFQVLPGAAFELEG